MTLGNASPAVASYNQNIIRADISTIPLSLQMPSNANFENNGQLVASGARRCKFNKGLFWVRRSHSGGRIEAYPGSTVVLGTDFSTVAVEGSVLAAVDDTDPLTAAPAFQFNAKLTNVSLEGNFRFTGATFVGTLRNSGVITPGTAPTQLRQNGITIWPANCLSREVERCSLEFAFAPFAVANYRTPLNYRVINVDNVIRGSSELLVSWADSPIEISSKPTHLTPGTWCSTTGLVLMAS